MEEQFNQMSENGLQCKEFHFDENATNFEDFFKDVGANTSSPKKKRNIPVDDLSSKPLSKYRLGKIEFEASSLLFKDEDQVSAVERKNQAKQRHREREKQRAYEEKKALLRLFEMLPPSLKNVKTQIKQLTNVVHYIAFLEMFVGIHERDSKTYSPLLHSVFGPDFRKELLSNSSLPLGTRGAEEDLVLEDIISNLKTRINQLFVHQQQPAMASSLDLSCSALSPMDSVESIRSLSSDLSFPYEANRSGTSFDEMQETQEINVILPARFVQLRTNPHQLDSIFS